MERNDKHKLDRLLREKLDAPQHAYDAGLWQNIERELDKRKRRGFFMRKRNIFLLLLLIGGSATMFAVYHNNSNTEQSNNVAKEYSPVAKPADAIHQDVSTNTQTNNTSTSGNTTTTTGKTFAATNDNNHDNNTSNDSQNAALATTSESGVSVTSASVNANANSDEVIEREPTKQDAVVENETEWTLVDEDVSVVENDDQSIVVTGDEVFVETEAAETIDAIDDYNANVAAADSFHQAVLADTAAIAVLDKQAEKNSEVEKITRNPFTQKRITWSIAMFAQLNQVSKQIDAAGYSPFYEQRRNTEEQSALAVSNGLRAGFEYKRFTVQSGVGVRTFAEDIYYENRSQRHLLRSVSYVQDTLPYQYDTTTVSEVNNKLDASNGHSANRYLEIPLLVGYRIGNSDFSIIPSVGISFAKPMRWSSRYLNSQTNDLVDPQNVYGLNPFVKSFMSELRVAMALSNRFYLDATAAYNRNFESVFKKSSGLNQRYQSIGGGVGLRYTF